MTSLIILQPCQITKLLEELAELESEETTGWNKIFWNSLSLLVIEPAIISGTVYYFWSQIKQALSAGMAITNLGSNLKWTAIGFAVNFTLTSLTLIFYLRKVSSLKKQIAKIMLIKKHERKKLHYQGWKSNQKLPKEKSPGSD
jgi:hypothetical protein